MSSASDTLRDGPTRIGKYEVLSRIGVGGMAEVYLARQPGMAGFSKTVVVKRLKPQYASDPRFVQLFIEEAKLAAQVQHKNVVQIFELGSDDGAVFMAMEYVMGADLKSLLVGAGRSRIRFPTWLSVHAVCEVLEALAFANELKDDAGRSRQIVHCDVSPENVFLARHGEVKLGDFGVAWDATRKEDPFPEGLKGKLPYMAPERVRGERPTHASDVYAAGVVLWECLAQRRLFVGTARPMLARKILAGVRVPPSRYSRDVSAGLDVITLQALHPDPGSRHESARHLQAALLVELSKLRSRVSLEDVRRELMDLMASAEVDVPADKVTTDPDIRVPTNIDPSSDFQILLSDVISDLSVRTGKLPDLPAALSSSLSSGNWPAVPHAGHEEHVDPEITAVVRARKLPRRAPEPMPAPVDPNAPPRAPRPPVWVRSRGGVQIGPRDPLEALGVLEELGSDDARQALEITSDQSRWLPVLDLPRLLDEAHLASEPTLPAGELCGSFQSQTPASVLAHVARSGARGRLVFIRYETVHTERVEIVVEMGHAVGFGSSAHLLPGWSSLLANHDAVPDDMVQALCQVIAKRQPVSAVASLSTQGKLRDARRVALRRVLAEVLAWPYGRFGFEVGSEAETGQVTPLALWPLLPKIVAEAKPVPVMMAHLTSVLDIPMVTPSQFDREVRELGLELEDRARLDRFGEGRTLRESFAFATSLRDELPTVRLGYLLREVGLLLPQEEASAPDNDSSSAS